MTEYSYTTANGNNSDLKFISKVGSGLEVIAVETSISFRLNNDEVRTVSFAEFSTANEVASLIQADESVSEWITVELAPGSDGSGAFGSLDLTELGLVPGIATDWTANDAVPITATTTAYLSEAEADALVLTRPNSTAWTGTGKAAALQEATRRIDALHLRGYRYEEPYIYNGTQKDIDSDGLTQVLEFPRIIDGVVCGWDYATSKPIVPNLVKLACLEEAISILSQGTSGGDRRALQEQGVVSFSIGGKLSETFRPGAGSEGLISSAAKRYMKRYTGVEMR